MCGGVCEIFRKTKMNCKDAKNHFSDCSRVGAKGIG